MNCEIEVFENETILEFPYIYYPGYKITVNGEVVENFESENGFLAISLPEISNSEVIVEYVGTNLMTASKIISEMTLISIIAYEIYKRNIKKVEIENSGENKLLFIAENDKMKK